MMIIISDFFWMWNFHLNLGLGNNKYRSWMNKNFFYHLLYSHSFILVRKNFKNVLFIKIKENKFSASNKWCTNNNNKQYSMLEKTNGPTTNQPTNHILYSEIEKQSIFANSIESNLNWMIKYSFVVVVVAW